MWNLCYRNLLLYFRNKSEVFFSLLGALISFILYVAFLQDTIAGDWKNFPGHTEFLDLWLIGGTLGITAITTTLSSLSQRVEDHERNTDNDFLLTGASHFQLDFGYVLSAAIIGFVMQIIVFGVMFLYFYLVDDLTLPLAKVGLLVLLMVLGSLLNSVVNAVIMIFVHNRNTLSAVSTVVGTVSGFLVGAYIPLGILPDFAQFFVKLTPGAYVSSLYRQVLLDDSLQKFFSVVTKRAQFSEQMGIQLKWGKLLNYERSIIIIIVLFVAFLLFLFIIEYLLNFRKTKRTLDVG